MKDIVDGLMHIMLFNKCPKNEYKPLRHLPSPMISNGKCKGILDLSWFNKECKYCEYKERSDEMD